jgi:hypothetical protein
MVTHKTLIKQSSKETLPNKGNQILGLTLYKKAGNRL